MEEKLQNARLEWPDLIKAFLIYTMVLCHVGTWSILDKCIHSFHMPLFFVLSGYMYDEVKNNNFLKFIKKKFLTLIVPYLFFSVVLFAVWNAALYVLNRHGEMRPVSNLLQNMLWINTEAQTFGVVQWFLTCLFFTSILFYLICKIAYGNKIIIGCALVVLSALGYLYPVLFDFRLPLAIDTALTATVFYGVGWLVRSVDLDKILHIKSPYGLIVFAGWGTLLTFSSIFLNSSTNMRCIDYGNYFLYYFNAIGFFLWFTMLAKYIEKLSINGVIYKFLLKIGQCTLVILLLNSSAIRVWQVICPAFISNLDSWKVYIINIFVAIVLTLACTGCAIIIEMILPECIGKKRVKSLK